MMPSPAGSVEFHYLLDIKIQNYRDNGRPMDQQETYLFDESISVIRAADRVHEVGDLLDVPQPGVLAAVAALVQQHRGGV